MKNLLTLTAILEPTIGLGLIIVPGFVVLLLLGTALVEPAGIFMSRLTGVALTTSALICWSYRTIAPGSQGIFKALIFYNTAAGVLLLVVFVNGYYGSLFGRLCFCI